MNFLYLSPAFPPNFAPFVQALSESGVRVLAIGTEEFYAEPCWLRSAQAEYCQVSSLENREEVFGAVSYLLDKYGTIRGIDSLQEHWIFLEAAIRERFDIAGLKPIDLSKLTRKSGMKEIFRSASVSVSPGELVSSYEQAAKFLSDHGPRIVIKPDRGVGAWNTYSVSSESELAQFFSRPLDTTYFMEAFIDGELLSFDGLVNSEGEIVFQSAMVFPLPIMEVVQDDLDLYYYTLRDIPPALALAGQRCISALDLKSRFFHLEFFRSRENNEYIALEANLRPPGLLTTDMWNYAHDFDIYRGWAKIINGESWKHHQQPPWHVIYISRKHHHHYAHNEQQLRAHFGSKLCLETSLAEVFSQVGGNRAFVLRAPGISELLDYREFSVRRP